VFNKTEEDFPNINDYKDYEEMIEDIIYNIVRGINVPEMEEKIEKYKQENARAITLKFSELQKRDKEEMILIREEESKRAKRETEAAVRWVYYVVFLYICLYLSYRYVVGITEK